MYSSGSFEIFSNSCNTLGVSVDKLNSSIHSDYSCGGSDKGGGGGGPGGLVVLSSRDHIGQKEIEEEEGVAEEAAMAAHLFKRKRSCDVASSHTSQSAVASETHGLRISYFSKNPMYCL